MKKVAVTDFRANLLKFLKCVEKGEEITLTSRGHEIAKIVPPYNKTKEAIEALKELRKTAIIGDILSPIGDEWESLK